MNEESLNHYSTKNRHNFLEILKSFFRPTFHSLTSVGGKSFSVCLLNGAAFSCCNEESNSSLFRCVLFVFPYLSINTTSHAAAFIEERHL